MRDGSKLHSLVEMLEDDIEENPHTVAVKLPVASYFPCKTSEASTLSELGLDTVRQGSEGTAQEIANSYNSQATAIVLPLRIDSHVHTVPTINHTPLTGRQRKYAGIKYVNTRVAFVRTDSVLFWSPRDDSHLFAYLSNRKISIPRTDTNVTDSKNKKKWRNSAAASESIEGTDTVVYT